MATRHKQIQNQVLKRITPTKKERKKLFETIHVLVELISKELKKRHIHAKVEIVGSTAKDTFLKNNLDIDAFIIFPKTTSRQQLKKQGILVGKKILKKPEECYAEHPYIRGYYNGYKTEIVPCYQIGSATQKLSAVDRTPLHTRYIQQHLQEQQKQEVRLLKQFFKGIGCYGAEAEIEGFSGYLCEILILKYNTFWNFVTHAQKWKYGEYLTLTGENSRQFDTPLIFIDPVDPTRNVASAVSHEKFDICKKACQAYLQKPALTFFYPRKIKPWSKQHINKKIKRKKYIGIQFPKPQIISENLFPQLRKAIRAITDLCERYDFHIQDSTFFVGTKTVYLIFELQQEKLTKSIIHEGPPLHLTKHVDDFIKKWENNPYTMSKLLIQNNKIYVKIKRNYITVYQLLEDQLKRQSLGKHIDAIIRSGKFKILKKNNLIRENLLLDWTRYLSKSEPWE